MRLFVAIELPAAVKKAITAAQEELKRQGSGVSWVRPDNIHCTLKFLGEVDEQRFGSIETALAGVVGPAPFEMAVRGAGVFPNLRDPRVIWLGLSADQSKLAGLYQSVEQELAAIKFPREKRPFHPHLTLGRVRWKDRLGGVPDKICSLAQAEVGPAFAVKEFILFRSVLQPSGSVYTALKRFELKG